MKYKTVLKTFSIGEYDKYRAWWSKKNIEGWSAITSGYDGVQYYIILRKLVKTPKKTKTSRKVKK